MLSTRQLRALCAESELELDAGVGVDEDGKPALIAVLAKHLRSKVVMLLTDGSKEANAEAAGAFDTATIAQVDAADLPSNFHGMEREELACVAASYGIAFSPGEVKETLIRRLEGARFKGSGVLMLEG